MIRRTAISTARYALLGVQLGAVVASGVGALVYLTAWWAHDAAALALTSLEDPCDLP